MTPNHGDKLYPGEEKHSCRQFSLEANLTAWVTIKHQDPCQDYQQHLQNILNTTEVLAGRYAELQ